MNMMQFVAMQPMLQPGHTGLVLEGKDLASEGTAFAALMSSYTTESQTPTESVEAGSPAELFNLQLTQVLELMEKRGVLADLGEARAERELDLDLEVDEAADALMSYLNYLLQQFLVVDSEYGLEENDSILKNERLFLLLQSIPNDEQLNPYSQRANDSSPAVAKADEAWQRWNLLLTELLNSFQAQDKYSVKLEENPRQAMLVSLLNKWQEDQEWLSFLREKVEQARLQISPTAEEDNNLLSRSRVPFLLLNQLEQGMEQKQAHPKEEMLLPFKESTTFVSNKGGLQSDNLNLEVKVAPIEGVKTPTLTDARPVESPAQSVRFSHLTEDLKAVFSQQLRLLKEGETAQLRLRITPEHLGHLDIRITSQEGKIIAQLIASSTVAKELLEAQVQQLRLSLGQQGIQVERVEVTQATNQHTSFLHDQRNAQQFFQQRENKNGLGTGNHYVETVEEDEQESISDDQQLMSQINYVV